MNKARFTIYTVCIMLNVACVRLAYSQGESALAVERSLSAPFLAGQLAERSAQVTKVFVSMTNPDGLGNMSHRDYEVDLIRLALSKTEANEGPFVIEHMKRPDCSVRELRDMQRYREKNFIRTFSAEQKLLTDDSLSHIAFPAVRGLLGYRVCYVSDETKKEFAESRDADLFLSKTHVQGTKWLDVKILHNAGLTVHESRSYASRMRMVSRGRVDLYCLGIVEVASINESRQREKYKVALDETFLLRYPLVRFFFGNKKDQPVLDRIERGLKIAYKDGSFVDLWEQHFADKIELSRIPDRVFVSLPNNELDYLDKTLSPYMYAPEWSR